MSLLGRIFGRGKQASKQTILSEQQAPRHLRAPIIRKPRDVSAQYDAAQNSRFNENYWRPATSKSADAEMPLGVRTKLRNRGRYEVRNNSYAEGIVATKANNVIGTGPRLQVTQGDSRTEAGRAVNSAIEARFHEWVEEVMLAEKLRTGYRGIMDSGEGFLAFTENPAFANAVKLDIQTVECDRITTPALKATTTSEIYFDGITYDKNGNPVSYDVAKQHPGAAFFMVGRQFDTVLAKNMIHLYHKRRPGQRRGVPDLTPALALFAQLRRYRAAVLDAAETAADFAAVLESTGDDVETADVGDLDILDIERRVMTTMPKGWSMKQFKAEHPNSEHSSFVRVTMNEIARCLNMPLNIALADSSGYNYASGRLDHQVYFKEVAIEQSWISQVAMERIFRQWWAEASRVRGLIGFDRISIMPTTIPVHRWFWDGLEHVDPQREANAERTKVGTLTLPLSEAYARRGKDWEQELRQIARERDLMEELGLTFATGVEDATAQEDETREEGAA